MSKNTIVIIALIAMFYSGNLYAQNKIAIDDQSNLINEQVELLLVEKFQIHNLDYNNMVDYRERCQYYFAEIFQEEGSNWVLLMNCDNEKLGEKKLTSGISQMPDNDKAAMIVYTIIDIIENPADLKSVAIKSKKTYINQVEVVEDMEPSGENEHTSRYFFSPSSYNLKEGELYYNTIYFLIHDAQYGVTDNFSVGMGTTLGAFPFYLTPKYSFELSEKHRAAIGDMFILGTYGVEFGANLLYGTYTYGTPQSNITLGGGWIYSPENDLFNNTVSKPVINLSGMAQLSDYIYFISENYMFNTNTTFNAYYFDWQPNPPIEINETFDLRDNWFVGFFGFRFISKKQDVKAWQAGLVYYNRGLPNLPDKYNGDLWDTNYPNMKRLFLPQISYTYKFGKKY